jgi:Sigma-70, region 4
MKEAVMDEDTRDEMKEGTLAHDGGVGGDGAADDAPSVSRKVRQKRRTRARSKTIAPKRLTKEELRFRELLPILEDPDRPRTRGECMTDVRPCPYVSCKHHLYLDVNPETGSIKLNFPDLEVWEMAETCSLDVADRGGITLEEVGEILNLTRERIRQVEVRGLLKLKMVGPGEEPLPGDPGYYADEDE